MFDKLNKAEQRYAQVEQDLSNPEIISNQEAFTKLMKEYKSLSPIIEKYREFKKTKSDMEGARSLMDEGGELYEMALEEYKECKERLEVIEQELKILLIPKDPNDDKNVIIEIRGGAGGEEASLRPFISGAAWFNDTYSGKDEGGRESTCTVRRSCAISVGVNAGE